MVGGCFFCEGVDWDDGVVFVISAGFGGEGRRREEKRGEERRKRRVSRIKISSK